jgi:hypothetical protein
MKKFFILTGVLLSLAVFNANMTNAQFSIPKLPKVKKPDTQQPATSTDSGRSQPTNTGNTNNSSSRSSGPATNPIPNPTVGDEPTVAKDSIIVKAFTFGEYKGKYDTWSWVPNIEFRVNGPIESGNQLYAEFSLPTGSWVKFDCQTGETVKGRWWKTECGGRDGIPEDKGMTYTGPVSFTIKLRNELAGTDKTLYTGKIKTGKVHSNETGPNFVNHWVYYVDQDWNLPIGYIYFSADDVRGWDFPGFSVVFWVRGDAVRFDPHLFYQGQEVGKIFYDSTPVGTPSCGMIEEVNTTHFVADSVPQKARWARVECSFPNIKMWDKTGEKRDNFPGQTGKIHMLADNPGEYEFKLLWNNHLARSIKFTVGADGKVVDNGIASGNRLGSSRLVFPVQIIGDQDGAWDRAAWKTDAFYGNPLTGFTALP